MESRGMIIVMGSTKGGPGKTSIGCNIAVEIARQGASVLVTDSDLQRSAAKFFERREDLIEEGRQLPEVHCIEKLGMVKKTLLEQAKHFNVVICDTAGRDSQEMRSAFLAADLVLIPTEASQLDIETLEKTVEVLKETEEMNEDRIVRTVINKAPTNFNANDHKDAKEFISASFGDYISPMIQVIRSRKAYKESFKPGLSVVEFGDSKAKAEIQLLVKEIDQLMNVEELA